ncbi:hypothetical protein E0I03_05490 [Dickeya dadantii]|nr:hypothetical protein [Dickeya dadantii]
MRDILSLTGGQPLAGQINSFPTNLSLGCRVTRLMMSLALTGQRVALFNTNVLSCNSNYFRL